MHDLAVLATMWVSVFVASYFAHRTRLTPVLWYLFFGAVFVNLGILPTALPVFIQDLAELGIIIIMFAIGFEENTASFITGIKRSWGIALFGAVVPFGVGYLFADWFWGQHNISLFVALAMTATAVSLTMVSLKSEGLSKTPAATGIMTSAVLDDIASLALVAILVPIAVGTATVSITGIFTILGKAIVFFALVTIMGAWLFPARVGRAAKIPFLRKLHLSRVLAMGQGQYTVLSLLLIAVVVGLIAHEFGFHPAVGAYMAGLIVRREYFDFHQEQGRDHYQHSREIIDNAAFSWIGPIFFVSLGTKLMFELDIFISVLFESVTLFIALFIGQVLSAGLAARWTGGFDWPSSWLIGFGMLGRAELAFVVMDIAYVQNHILNQEAFYTLMLVAFLLNVSVPLTISAWKKRYAKIQKTVT
ncbi:cation:proton antiporter [Alteromonas lipolytica]|uniref:cation:proton antiporter n=1 Tax=Alteromonas lipolytica TaxID=1856405 RepID=UPI0009F33612|nr:cation:proton antiporter [Alteromonas lipolytica]GGF55103.1 sodium:proton antiporter [Alteromonas lipolytica]